MRERAFIIHAIQCAEAFAELFSSTTPTPAPAPMTARLRELMTEATPGPICESALVPLYAVQGYGYNEVVAAFAEFDDEGELTMQFQGEKAKANLALYTFLVNNAPTILRLLEAVEGAEKALARLDVFWTAEFPEGPENPEPWGKIDVRLSEETIAIWCSIRSALATLRAAREGAR